MPRPSPSLVISAVALFVSLGGTGYAALTITGKNVKNSSLTGKDLKNNSVTGKDVRSLGPADFKGGRLPAGPAGEQGPPGPPGRDATPADFAAEAARLVAAAPVAGDQCTAAAQFCTGSNNWRWRSYGNGYRAVGFWKDRGGVVHLEGVAELFGGAAGGQPPAFILPAGYRPTGTRRFSIAAAVDAQPNSTQVLRFVEVRGDGHVDPDLGGAGIAPLDGITFRP